MALATCTKGYQVCRVDNQVQLHTRVSSSAHPPGTLGTLGTLGTPLFIRREEELVQGIEVRS